MIIITLARKPLTRTMVDNINLHGAGGFNIDSCRVAPTGERLGGGDELTSVLDGKAGGWSRPWMHDQEKIKTFAAERKEQVEKATLMGRWPANLILMHRTGCKKIGIKQVEGNRTDGRPEGDGGREDKTQWRFRPTDATRRGYAGADGKESAEEWECVDGCPVAVLDGKSGVVSYGNKPGGYTYTGSEYAVQGFVTSCKPVAPSNYGDTGGASRFFKQVQSE